MKYYAVSTTSENPFLQQTKLTSMESFINSHRVGVSHDKHFLTVRIIMPLPLHALLYPTYFLQDVKATTLESRWVPPRNELDGYVGGNEQAFAIEPRKEVSGICRCCRP